MEIADELALIVDAARKRVRALRDREGIGVWELVQIELLDLRLADAVSILRAATSPEDADIEAPEITHKSH